MSVLFTDTFDGTGADLGANWTVETGAATWERVSDTAEASDLLSDCCEYVNSVTPPADQYAQLQVTTDNVNTDNNFNGAGPAVRMATGALTWYGAVVQNTRIKLMEATAGTFAQLGTFSTTWVDGDTLYIEIQSSGIKVKINGVERISLADSSIASGRFGVIYGSTVVSMSSDNFEGGDFASLTKPMFRGI